MSRADPYAYVYVNADGSARELHPEQCDYLETEFLPGDGNRPWIKGDYAQRNGRGDLAGFLKRSELPHEVGIQPAPAENPSKSMTIAEYKQRMRDEGYTITENPDGSFRARKPKSGL